MSPRIVACLRNALLGGGFVFLNSITIISSRAQPGNPPAVQWQRTYGGNQWESASAILSLSDGGFLLGGQSYSGPGGTKSSENFGDYDYWIVRLDRFGNPLWDRSFGGGDQESLQACIATAGGGFVLAGRSFSFPSGNKTATNFGGADYWIVRIDGHGNKLWDSSFGGTDWDECMTIVATPDGGFLAGGRSQSGVGGNKTTANHGDWDGWIVRLDSGGNRLWDVSFGGTSYDDLRSIALTHDDGFLLAGASASRHSAAKRSQNYGLTDFWVIRLDSSGAVLWDQSYGGDNSDDAWGIVQTPDHGFAMAGWSASAGGTGNKTATNIGITDGWIVRADSDGNRLWDQSAGAMNPNSSDYFWSLALTADGGFLVGGGSEGMVDSPTLDAWAVRLDGQGTRLWETLLGSPGMDRVFAVGQASDGGFLLAGDFDAWGAGSEALLIKLAPDSLTRPPTLRVPPQSRASIVDTGFRMSLMGSPNVLYRIDGSSDLGIWQPLQTNLLMSQEEEIFDRSATNDLHRAYRATILPR